MSVSFHRNFYCFRNINEIVTAFWNLNFDTLSLLCWAALTTSPDLNKTGRISKNIVFIRQIWKLIMHLEIDQSHLIFSCAVQLEWWVKSCLNFCRILWNHNLSLSFQRSISLNFFETFCVAHLLNNIKVVKSRSVFPAVLWQGQINHNKIVWLRPPVFTQLFELFFRHVLRHVVIEYVVNILLVLRKQTKEICIFSNCLTR